MKNYIDRKKFAIELFFAEISPAASRYNEFTPQESVVRIAKNLPRIEAIRLCSDLQNGIKTLAQQFPDCIDLIPRRVLDIGLNPVDISPSMAEMFLSFFNWIEEIYVENEQKRTLWQSSLRDVSADLGESMESFCSAFINTVTHRIAVNEVDGKLTVRCAGNPWGDIELEFEDYQVEGTVPNFGLIHWIEAEKTAGGYEFRISIDNEISVDNTYSRDRLLCDDGWSEIAIKARSVRFSVKNRNYIERELKSGTDTKRCMINSLRCLLIKSCAVAKIDLGQNERKLLPLAKIMEGFHWLQKTGNSKFGKINMNLIYSILDDAYEYDMMIHCISDFCTNEIYNILKSLGKAFENGTYREVMSETKKLYKALKNWYEDEKPAGEFPKGIIGKLKMDCDNFDQYNVSRECFEIVHDLIQKDVEPMLTENGFRGEFPNYRRVSEDNGVCQYITIASSIDTEFPRKGIMTHYFSLKLAQVNLADMNKGKVDFLAYTAQDFSYTSHKNAEISTEIDHSEVKFQYNYYEKEILSKNFIEEINKILTVAFAVFDKKPIPDFYKKNHLNFLHGKNPIKKLFLDNMHIAVLASLICSVIAALSYKVRGNEFISHFGLDGTLEMILFIIFGGLISLTAAVVYKYIKMKKTVWRI